MVINPYRDCPNCMKPLEECKCLDKGIMQKLLRRFEGRAEKLAARSAMAAYEQMRVRWEREAQMAQAGFGTGGSNWWVDSSGGRSVSWQASTAAYWIDPANIGPGVVEEMKEPPRKRPPPKGKPPETDLDDIVMKFPLMDSEEGESE